MTHCKNETLYQFEKNRGERQEVLVEKIIDSIGFSNPYENPTEKNLEITETVEVIIKYPGEFTSLFLLILLTALLNTFIP